MDDIRMQKTAMDFQRIINLLLMFIIWDQYIPSFLEKELMQNLYIYATYRKYSIFNAYLGVKMFFKSKRTHYKCLDFSLKFWSLPTDIKYNQAD